jgi:hypothetical protein
MALKLLSCNAHWLLDCQEASFRKKNDVTPKLLSRNKFKTAECCPLQQI